MTKPLEQIVLDDPIRLPPNPFTEALVTFGRDEILSGVGNVGGAALCSLWLRGNNDALLAASGLTIEKVGLFGWYFYDAWKHFWRGEKKNWREGWQYLKAAVREGMPSLIKDITIHDPMDYACMYFGLQAFPDTPTAMISLTSFTASVIAASLADVGVNELRYRRYKDRFQKAGFGKEEYVESRFLIDASRDPHAVQDAIRKQFHLDDTGVWEYHDTYVENTIPRFNARTPQIRLRHRHSLEGGDEIRTAQVVFTKARETIPRKYRYFRENDQFRYFVCMKDKLYLLLDDPMPKSVGDIPAPDARKVLQSYCGNSSPSRQVQFSRRYTRNDDLLVTVDNVFGDRSFYVLEMKVRKNVPLLRDAMRYVMRNFAPLETTRNKLELTADSNSTPM